MVAGLAISPALLAVDVPLLVGFTAHLAALVAFGLGLAHALAPRSDEAWFSSLRYPGVAQLASAAAVVIIVTGVVGLVTLASSAALRFHPSTQFLQLISALDIAWATTAVLLGVRWARSRRLATWAASALGIVCVWSIWRYLVNVGFGPDGEWLVTRAALFEYVLPFDVAAAFLAVGAVVAGIRRRQATWQPSAQS